MAFRNACVMLCRLASHCGHESLHCSMRVAFAVLQESEMGSEAFLPNTLKLNNYTAVCPG